MSRQGQSGPLIFHHTHISRHRTSVIEPSWIRPRMASKTAASLLNEESKHTWHQMCIHDTNSWSGCDTSVLGMICGLHVPVHRSPRCWMLECVRKPFQLLMASSPSPVSSSFSLLSSLSLHYPECLIMAPVFWEHVNMAAAPLAGKMVFLHPDWLTGEEHGWRGRRRWWLP